MNQDLYTAILKGLKAQAIMDMQNQRKEVRKAARKELNDAVYKLNMIETPVRRPYE